MGRKRRLWYNRRRTIWTKRGVRDSLLPLFLFAKSTAVGIRVRADHRKWLLPPDPSTNQNIASGVQHEGTATWFFQGNLFIEWKSKSTTSLLWIHGKRTPLYPLTASQTSIVSNYCSGFREEYSLVRIHSTGSPMTNLHRWLAPQSSKI
jgi:hypothetical protein